MPSNFDFENPPFDRLNEEQRSLIRDSLDMAFFPAGEILIKEEEEPDSLFVIIKGIIQEYKDEKIIDFYSSQDIFDAASLLKGKATNSFKVQEEAICYLVPKQLFLDISKSNEKFGQYFTESLAEKHQAQLALADTGKLASFMIARIKDACLNPLLVLEEKATIKEAALYMREKQATSLLVKKGKDTGIISGTEIRDSLAIEGKSADSPVADIADYNPVMIDENDFLFEAQILMTKHHIRSLPVTKKGEITGILELTDLLSYISDHSHLVALQIDRAENVRDLKQASQNIAPMILTLHGRGMKITHITELVTDLNRKIFNRLFNFLATDEIKEKACLIVMGSEGRGEQVLKTDQDNALILKDESIEKDVLKSFCNAFTKALIDFGYPPCDGNMMVSNPEWSKSVAEYKKDITEWVLEPDGETHLKLAAFVDAQPVAGEYSLFEQTRGFLTGQISGNDSFYSHFAKPILSFDTPLGIFKQLQVERGIHSGKLDIKTGGIFPIVHGIRAFAVEKGIASQKTGTFERIDALVEMGIIEKRLGKNLKEAFEFLLNLKLTVLLEKAMSGDEADSYIQAHTLSKLERDLLKESLHIVREFKSILIYHFKLSLFSP